MRSAIVGLAAACGLWSAVPAAAVPFSTALDFTAPLQSMWKPGGGMASFSAEGDWSVGPFGLDYSFGASSGTVSAQFNGDLTVNHPTRVSRTGKTALKLQYAGDQNGGYLQSDFGAWAEVNVVGISILDENYGLNLKKTFTSVLDQPVSVADDVRIGGAEVNILVAKAGAEVQVEQTDDFEAQAIKGTLAYSRRGSGLTRLTPFSITNSNELNLDVVLSDWGIWDFSVVDVVLDNSFATSFDLGLVIYETHVDGIRFCRRCLWGICVPIPCGVDYDRNEAELASINVYEAKPFALAFNSISAANAFSITVPEPNSLALMAVGLLGLVGAGRRQCS